MAPERRSAPAFAERYADCAPALLVWISSQLGPALRRELDPEDVLQEVACRAFARQEAFDERKGTFRDWMFGIARNVLLRALETLATPSGRHAWLSTGGLVRVPDDATSVTQRVARDDALGQLVAWLETLADEDRALVLHRGLEGLSHEAVGQTLGIAPAAAAKRWERLRTRLSEHDAGTLRILE